MARKVVVKLHKLIDKNNISMRHLSRLTDIRHQTLNDLANQKTKRINFDHIERISDAMDINDIREIIDLEEFDKKTNPTCKK